MNLCEEVGIRAPEKLLFQMCSGYFRKSDMRAHSTEVQLTLVQLCTRRWSCTGFGGAALPSAGACTVASVSFL